MFSEGAGMNDNNSFYLYATTRSGKWYRCRICGYSEHYIPPECPICHGKRPESENGEPKSLTLRDLLE